MRNKKNQGLSGEQDNECFLDKTLVKTFDNHRYQVKLGKCYHVAMTSYPKNDPESPTQKQNIPKDSRVSVLAKETEGGKKVLKVTLGEKEIKLTPSDTQRAEVTIDDKKVDLSKKRSYQEKQEEKVLFEVLKQEDRSIKIISDKYDIKIVYDGSRAKLEAGDRYRSSVRGLCGNKDGEPEDDQQTPKGCLLQRPEEFAATYALTSDEKCEGPARQNAEKARKSKCSPRMIKPGNVISEKEAGRKSDDKDSREDDEDQEKRCTRHRTMVKKSTDEICFSLRPVPKCSSKCSPSSTKPKNIQFYCVSRSSASEKIAERIENGANPDLSQKKVSKTENLEVPVSCKP
ncbi:hypothetical protein QAD02_003829 [Eretmocerus hayati]|uniref:Uncharacterized protein n=1 Tax=Eretmocerus hayati TaxID=131215 RepID=A0ACC2NSP2_9HYME|nr:hypothetical protein QAD02_003829 [Eretmocerus hayati]